MELDFANGTAPTRRSYQVRFDRFELSRAGEPGSTRAVAIQFLGQFAGAFEPGRFPLSVCGTVGEDEVAGGYLEKR